MTEAKDGGTLAFAVDNVDVFDRRDFSWGWHAYSRARYHVGDFLLRPVGRITCATLRLDLYRAALVGKIVTDRSEEHTSELQSLMRISYAVFCLKKKKHIQRYKTIHIT